jgi:hypothetical protein
MHSSFCVYEYYFFISYLTYNSIICVVKLKSGHTLHHDLKLFAWKTCMYMCFNYVYNVLFTLIVGTCYRNYLNKVVYCVISNLVSERNIWIKFIFGNATCFLVCLCFHSCCIKCLLYVCVLSRKCYFKSYCSINSILSILFVYWTVKNDDGLCNMSLPIN